MDAPQALERSIRDLGYMGCREVPMEFRRVMQSLEVGEVIEFRMRDPAAKDDLPSLARMMGHRILSEKDLDDGYRSVVVERAR